MMPEQQDLRSAEEITARFDRQELVKGWQLVGSELPRVVPVTRLGLKTDLGCLRENNEDRAEFYEPDDPGILAARGALYIVADGMGGHAAGQIASELAIKKMLAAYYGSRADDVPAALTEAVQAANEHVFQVAAAVPGRSGMGTTLTALALVQDRAYLAHVGDSRAYLIRNGGIQQVTEDHTWVQEQVQKGILTPEEAELSPYRNVITRCIGTQPDVEPDMLAVESQAGDTWLLCSDGLTGHVRDPELLQIVRDQAPSEACRQLVDLACARGGSDNITVLIVRLVALQPYDEPA